MRRRRSAQRRPLREQHLEPHPHRVAPRQRAARSTATATTSMSPASTSSSNVTQVTVPANCVSSHQRHGGRRSPGAVQRIQAGGSGSRTINLDGISITVISDDTAQRTLTTGASPRRSRRRDDHGVSLAVTHSESTNSGQSVVVTPGGAGACSAVNLTQRASLTTDTGQPLGLHAEHSRPDQRHDRRLPRDRPVGWDARPRGSTASPSPSPTPTPPTGP